MGQGFKNFHVAEKKMLVKTIVSMGARDWRISDSQQSYFSCKVFSPNIKGFFVVALKLLKATCYIV